MAHQNTKPDYLFETSWEVCNKVGGIYTVISTKAISLTNELGDNFILIGPDVWKDSHEKSEFIEDKFLFRSWHRQAEKEGLKFRIGRWNIAGKPIVILVDFTPYFANKDLIFTEFWENYLLDSLTGQWDYVEPAIFGFAAAKIIESFYNYQLSSKDKIIAQFHEWMTGSGLLYLKKHVPQIGCTFTTHATAVGRSIAGNQLPLYGSMEKYNAEAFATQHGFLAKFSLERLSAVHADSFTVVSELTNNECKAFLGKEADLITPNGFEDSFVPEASIFEEKRSEARTAAINTVEAMLNQRVDKDALFVINSGRYEFHNKGIDLYIDALGELQRQGYNGRQIIAVIAIPANHGAAVCNVANRLHEPDFNNPISHEYTTHTVHDYELDPILNRIKTNQLTNSLESKIKVVYIPCYLDGKDGIINIEYYNFLIGFDLSVFPSYYEPWGYTPLESLAFSIPTITTTLAGFGLWIQEQSEETEKGAYVIDRTDNNDDYVTHEIVKKLLLFSNFNHDEYLLERENAFKISRTALWFNLVDKYYKAYHIALQKVESRADLFIGKHKEHEIDFSLEEIKKPTWKKILVVPSIPEKFADLHRLSRNIWWSWNYDAIELFKMTDPDQWEKSNRNPIRLLNNINYFRFQQLENNTEFIERYHQVINRFDNYMKEGERKDHQQVAYFSMEYGLHDSIKIYSGGLGMLAGDYLKEASDSNKNIIAVGLLYRYGYFSQRLSGHGEQIAEYFPQKFSELPLIPVTDENGTWLRIGISLPGRKLYAKAWCLNVGRVPLYLLDTDIEENSEVDRSVTHWLYGGDWENRFKQELLLGVGGIRFLQKKGLNPDLYHCNEGHAAFIGLERLRTLCNDEGLSFSQATEVVRASTLFTTHTPVPAGHDAFSENMLRTYIPHYADRLNISWDTFMNLGREVENDPDSKFSMSILALNLSQEVNGVSRIHGRVSREMFTYKYNGYFPDELHIDYVTNGVHYPTWTSRRWQELYKKTFGEAFLSDQSNLKHWNKIHEVENSEIWNIRCKQKKDLIKYLKIRINKDMQRRGENPNLILKITESLNENALIIGFARRFATYKRAHLLFNNLPRLAEILNNKEHPVQIVYAGKAHPADKAGQDLISRIWEISRMPEFIGKIFFIENYDMQLGSMLTQGVDIWLNTPTRPLEASGTSGEKAIMNGVVNFSVLDGWWAEGYLPYAGWALNEENTYPDTKFQDELDAETIYSTFENEIIPIYYRRNDSNLSDQWISYIKATIADIAPRFTMKRMIDDYYEKFYNKMFERNYYLTKDAYKYAIEITAWKKKMIRGWEDIELLDISMPSTDKPMTLGHDFQIELFFDTHEINPSDLGLEIIIGQKINDEVKEIMFKESLNLIEVNGSKVKFGCTIPLNKAGVFDYSFRMYPKNTNLPHRQDFNLIRWF